ncbi:MAG: flagellar basal-body MS-ring/collar protein FliF [Thioalkalispiraceae bacterium]|jgi:flagellar M-ring protein FliF
MATTDLAKTEQLNASFQGMTQLPIVRQVGLLLGLAASIAIGVYVVLWSQNPNYSILYHQASAKDAGEIVNVLQSKNIKYQVDTATGVILVETSKLHEARMSLAEQSLPSNMGGGFEFIKEPQGITTNDFIQTKRYQVALQNELARTIMWMSSIENARVHLALPKQSAFLSDRRKPSASVLLDMSSGHRLEDEQIEAIMNLVASSVPNLSNKEVTVVDQKGRLLSKSNHASGIGLSSRQLAYKKQIEQDLAYNIENIITPLTGDNKVRAQVVAEMDFTQLEMTQESFNPDVPAVRSEQRVEESTKGSANPGGIPGALSNQPPGAGQAPEQTGQVAAGTTSNGPSRSTVRYTINNELDRSIVHKRQSPGEIKKLSVAVVVDNKTVTNPEGEVTMQPYTKEELDRLTNLVKEAVGFKAIRGDTVSVMNAPFITPAPLGPAEEESLLDQPWVWDLGKQILGGLLAALVLFGILRPVMRNLSAIPKTRLVTEHGEADELAEDQVTLTGEGGQRIPKPKDYESELEMAKSMVVQEPKRVAQVVKQWVNE